MGHADKPAETRGPATIETEIEATRERLAGTIDQLLYRSSPKTIARREVASFKGFFVDPQSGVRTDNILKVVGGIGAVVALFVVVRTANR